MEQLSLCTLNVGKAGVSKVDACFSCASDFEVICLQEIQVGRDGAFRFVQDWRRRGYNILLGAADPDDRIRVALLSRLPLRKVQLSEDIDASRYVAAVIGTVNPVVISCVYGHADNLTEARKHACAVSKGLSCLGFPWVALGDWNAETDELCSLFAAGHARCLDDGFDPLCSTCTGSRRIDFGITGPGSRLFASELHHRPGVADHLLVGYTVPCDHSVRGGCGPRRAVVTEEAASAATRFHERWKPEDFASAVAEADVNLAWQLLSDAAEFALCADVRGCVPRSEEWSPTQVVHGPRAARMPESVELRRLRRLLRRLHHLRAHPEDWQLRQNLVRGARDLIRRTPVLHGMSVHSALDYLETVDGLVQSMDADESAQRLRRWRDTMAVDRCAQRKWVKQQAQLRKEFNRSDRSAFVHGSKLHSIHPAATLKQGVEAWTQVWRQGEIDEDSFQDMLRNVPRPAAVVACPRLTEDLLRQSAKAMLHKAQGPDGWTTEHLLRLPSLWWQSFACLWCRCLDLQCIPARWCDARVCLLPKEGTEGTQEYRPLGIASVAWRCGMRAIVRSLRSWMLQWLDCTVLGGVPAGSVADAHIIMHSEKAYDSAFVCQDLSKFFDTVDRRLLRRVMTWLKAPAGLIGCLESFYGQGRRMFTAQSLLADDWHQAERGLLQGCPASPMIAAMFLLTWSRHVCTQRVRALSFVDDRTFWARQVGGDGTRLLPPVSQVLSEAKARSDEFDRVCGFNCRRRKCHIAAPPGVDVAELTAATGYATGEVLSVLGISHNLRTGAIELFKLAVEEVERRANLVSMLPCRAALRVAILKELVGPMFMWAAGCAMAPDSVLQRLRKAYVRSFVAGRATDTPMAVCLEIIGYDADPVAGSALRCLGDAVRFHGSSPRWSEDMDLSFLTLRWPQLFPTAANLLARMGWWASPDGAWIHRRDSYGALRSFEVGVDNFAVVKDWVADHFRVQALTTCSRITRDRRRAHEPDLAQGILLPALRRGARCLFQGHRLHFKAATENLETQSALVFGCTCWKYSPPGQRLCRDDPRARCLCGDFLPSRPHLVWQCEGTSECRRGVAQPTTRVEERLLARELDECPGPPPVVSEAFEMAVEAIQSGLVEHATLHVATDGSSADAIAASACFVAETDSTAAWGVPGQDQAPFRAEADAILLVLRASLHVLQTFPAARCKSLWIVSDCEAAISVASTGHGACFLLAQRLHDALVALRQLIQVKFCWVPSHGKASNKFAGNGIATLWQLRLWNQKADEAAAAARRARALRSARAAWFVTVKEAKEWEIKAVGALVATAKMYHDYVTVL